jgi:hypothetical protein
LVIKGIIPEFLNLREDLAPLRSQSAQMDQNIGLQSNFRPSSDRGQGPGEACELQLDSQYTRKKSYKQRSFLKKDRQNAHFLTCFSARFDFTGAVGF